MDEFSGKCRENKYGCEDRFTPVDACAHCSYKRFTVRDFKWDPAAIAAEKKQLAEAGAAEKEQWVGVGFLGCENPRDLLMIEFFAVNIASIM